MLTDKQVEDLFRSTLEEMRDVEMANWASGNNANALGCDPDPDIAAILTHGVSYSLKFKQAAVRECIRIDMPGLVWELYGAMFQRIGIAIGMKLAETRSLEKMLKKTEINP